MRIVQVERGTVGRTPTAVWLVLDDALAPRFLIHHGPAVHRASGETHWRYRVSRFALERTTREAVAFLETFSEAEAFVAAELGRGMVPRPPVEYPAHLTAERRG